MINATRMDVDNRTGQPRLTIFVTGEDDVAAVQAALDEIASREYDPYTPPDEEGEYVQSEQDADIVRRRQMQSPTVIDGVIDTGNRIISKAPGKSQP